MKILFVTASNLNLIGGDTIQFASSAEIYNKFAEVHVITNNNNVEQLNKHGFSNQIEFHYINNNDNENKINLINKLDEMHNFDYISIRGEELIDALYHNNRAMLKNKVISYITNENLEVEKNMELFENSKLVRFQTEEFAKKYEKIGYDKDNTFVEPPSIVDHSSLNLEKEYDLIYTGKVAPGWKVSKFMKLAMRYPDKKFCIVYSRIFNNMNKEHQKIIEWGLNNLNNIDVFKSLSREETINLIAKSKYSYCYRKKTIDNDQSTELSTKLIESINVNTYPILRKTKLHCRILGEDYPYYIDKISDFKFENKGDMNIQEFSSPYLQKNIAPKIKLVLEKNKSKLNYVEIKKDYNVNDIINILENGYYVHTKDADIKFKLEEYGITCINKVNEIEHNLVEEVNTIGYQHTDKTIILPTNKYQYFSKNIKLNHDYYIIEDQNLSIPIEDIEILLNKKFSFTTKNQRELLVAMSIVGRIESYFLKFNINTEIDVSKFNIKGVEFNRNLNNMIELELNEYTLNDLVEIAKGNEVDAKAYDMSDLVVVNNIYPSYNNLYAHAFVHTRVKLYRQNGVNPIVIVVQNSANDVNGYFYDNQMVFNLNEHGFKKLFGFEDNYNYAIHFVNEKIYKILNAYSTNNKKIVWFHGADCLSAEKKEHFHDLSNPKVLNAFNNRKWIMDIQDGILKRIFANTTYTSVFVSQWLYNTIKEDYEIDEERATVIANSINTQTFYFEPKKIKEKEKVKFLSIMPFLLEHDQYANKVLVDAIIDASTKEWFDKCEFSIYGRGSGFDYYMSKLNALGTNNIKYHETFLTHNQIKQLHSEHHVALFPNNQDTHGVSFYEAMSSGLVAISSNNSAKPEYCNHRVTGFLHNDQDPIDLSIIMGEVVNNYNNLSDLRQNGHNSVVEQFGEKMITEKELEVIFN